MWPGKRKSNKRGKKSLFYREGISVVHKNNKRSVENRKENDG